MEIFYAYATPTLVERDKYFHFILGTHTSFIFLVQVITVDDLLILSMKLFQLFTLLVGQAIIILFQLIHSVRELTVVSFLPLFFKSCYVYL